MLREVRCPGAQLVGASRQGSVVRLPIGRRNYQYPLREEDFGRQSVSEARLGTALFRAERADTGQQFLT